MELDLINLSTMLWTVFNLGIIGAIVAFVINRLRH